jgi:hypothetical protein
MAQADLKSGGANAAIRTLCQLVLLSGPVCAHAEGALDKLVTDAHVASANGCAVMTVAFAQRLRFGDASPRRHGADLRIVLRAVDNRSADNISPPRHEIVNVVDGAAGGVRALSLETDALNSPVLHVLFDRPTDYRVSQSGSLENLTVSIAAPGSNAPCPSAMGLRAPETKVEMAGPAAPISPAGVKFIEASMDEARAALKKRQNAEAAALLKKILRFPENPQSEEARELLARAEGVPPPPPPPPPEALGAGAPPRPGDAEFQDFMLRFPGEERRGFGRIMGRDDGRPAGMARGPSAPSTPPGQPKNAGETQWTVSGGVASSFVRDDSVNTMKDISIAPDPNADPDAHRVHQNMFLTNFDLYGSIVNDTARTKIKISGTDEHSVQSGTLDSNRYGVATAFVETNFRETDITARLGRQTRNTGGVLGRFDGGVLSYAYSDTLKFNAVAGAANWSRFDMPFRDSRFLYGASVDLLKVMEGFDATFYAVQQSDQWYVDRRGIGAEFRYFNGNKSAMGTIDYDVHFGSLNAAIGSGSWSFDDKSVLSGAVDYRRVPYLSSWNALQGQPFLTLYDMLKYDSQRDVRQFALDRTPVFESGMVSYSRPINENYQVVVDGTVTHLSGTPPSGGVDGTLPSGTEYYFSSQLMGQSIFTQGDMYGAALRYARLADSQVYFLDLNARYPISDDLKINPRLRVGQRNGLNVKLHETTVLPSFLFDYSLTKDVAIESEIGTKWIKSDLVGIRNTTKDVYVTLGLRSSFSTEGAYRCAGVLAPCLGMVNSMPRGEEIGKQERFYRGPSDAPEVKPISPPALMVEVGGRYVASKGKNAYDYYADDTKTERVSRLDYLAPVSNSGETFFRVDARRGLIRNVFVKGYAGLGRFNGGRLYDEDFPPLSLYSKTVSRTSGNFRYGVMDLGYNVYTDPRFRLGAFVGYHGWRDSTSASGCAQIGANPDICGTPIPTGVKLINERDHWRSFRAGAVLDTNIVDRVTWSNELALASVSQRARDTHYFTFGADPAAGIGAGIEAESVLKYQITDGLSLGAGVRWWHYVTHATDMYGQLLNYRTDRLGAFGQASYKIDFRRFGDASEDQE